MNFNFRRIQTLDAPIGKWLVVAYCFNSVMMAAVAYMADSLVGSLLAFVSAVFWWLAAVFYTIDYLSKPA